mmetsp:Transcript_142829/g.456426  ORF Transcript_142829/g.456426 Transcript_142829/m.456426 type:complete len:299 (+) Transcript_142829:1812-2708(+)
MLLGGEGVDGRHLPRRRQAGAHGGEVEVAQQLAGGVVPLGLHLDRMLDLRCHHIDLSLDPTALLDLIQVVQARLPVVVDLRLEPPVDVVHLLVELLLGLVLLPHVRILLAEGVELLNEVVDLRLLVVGALQELHEAPLQAVQAAAEISQMGDVPCEELARVLHELLLGTLPLCQQQLEQCLLEILNLLRKLAQLDWRQLRRLLRTRRRSPPRVGRRRGHRLVRRRLRGLRPRLGVRGLGRFLRGRLLSCLRCQRLCLLVSLSIQEHGDVLVQRIVDLVLRLVGVDHGKPLAIRERPEV